MRVTIKRHNQQYLNRLASQMECYDQTEVVNYLLTELKRINYSFNAEVNLGISTTQVIAHIPKLEPEEPGQFALSGLSAINDPALERLISIGIEQF